MPSRNVIKAIWLSYDFGLRADYEGFFTWLDNKDAKECGSNLAYIRYKVPENFLDKKSLIDFIKKDITNSIEISSNDRIYMIWRDSNTKNILGEFLFGNRKQPIWTGYGNSDEPNPFDSE